MDKTDKNTIEELLPRYCEGLATEEERLQVEMWMDESEEMQEMLQDTDLYQVEELTQRIKDAIATLPESYREAFVMHRFRDMSYKEIAEILGVSPKTVDYRIQQALKQLRVDLKDYLPLLLPILFP